MSAFLRTRAANRSRTQHLGFLLLLIGCGMSHTFWPQARASYDAFDSADETVAEFEANSHASEEQHRIARLEMSSDPLLVIRYAPIANFAYQLDCVSGVLRHCVGRADYAKLWFDALGVDANLSPDVVRWRELRAEHRRMTQPSASLVVPGWPYATIDPDSRVLAAGLGSRDMEDYQSRLALLMHDTISAEASEIVERLYRPFIHWWQAEQDAPGAGAAKVIASRILMPDVQQELASVRAIYGNPRGAERTAVVHLMFRPGIVDGDSLGGQNSGLESFAEFFPKEDGDQRVPVIVHEYAHFVYGSTPVPQAGRLRESIIKSGGDVGGPAWGLLNEALATALGNGRMQRRLMSSDRFSDFVEEPRSFYADEFVDRAGKALLPLVDQMAIDGSSIHDDDFANRFVESLRREFGSELNSPAMHLGDVVVTIDSSLSADGMLDAFGRQIASYSRWDYRERCCTDRFLRSLTAHPGVTRVALIRSSSIHDFHILPERLRRALDAVVSSSGGAVYVRREEGTPPLIVVAVDEDDVAFAEAAFKAIASSKALVEGFIPVSR